MNKKKLYDWELLLISNPIPSYLNKSALLTLSQASKSLRLKLNAKIFSAIKFNYDTLYKHRDYFEHKRILNFENYNTWERIKLFGKYNLNKDLTFREVQIMKFLILANDQLNKISIHCKSLTIDYLYKASYFLTPLTYQFSNLKTLTVVMSYLPLIKFNSILQQLGKLEVLDLKYVNFVKGSDDPENIMSLSLPQSLKELTYIGIRLTITDSPYQNTIGFITDEKLGLAKLDLDIPSIKLPNLIKFNYFRETYCLKLTNFLLFNDQLEDLTMPFKFLTFEDWINISNMINLTKLKIHKLNTIPTGGDIDKYSSIEIPTLSSLKFLNLNLTSNYEFILTSNLFLACSNLFKLKISTEDDSKGNLNRIAGLVRLLDKLEYLIVYNFRIEWILFKGRPSEFLLSFG